jgi:hypothetical protein
MNATLLIDAIVRQTTVLIAALATSAGQRAPLAHIADRVFADLARELNEQGLGHKVIADMFGMALRTYHTRVARIASSDTEQGSSLWEAVLTFIQKSGPLLRTAVLAHFYRDNDLVVRSVLRDLVDSGLVYQMGRGEATRYRAADAADLAAARGAGQVDHLLLVAVYRHGPIGEERLLELVPVEPAVLRAALGRLVAELSVVREATADGDRYRCEQCVIPFGAEAGWEAALFDHYQAMVTAVVSKLQSGPRRADLADQIGGSTFAFEIWPSHPLAAGALGCLKDLRGRAIALRAALDAYNRDHPKPKDEPWIRVTTYLGQTFREEDDEAAI